MLDLKSNLNFYQVRSASSGTGGVTAMALNRDYLIVGGSDGGSKYFI